MNPTQTETLSRVQGHLEAYAYNLNCNVPMKPHEELLAKRLREDAQALSSVLKELDGNRRSGTPDAPGSKAETQGLRRLPEANDSRPERKANG